LFRGGKKKKMVFLPAIKARDEPRKVVRAKATLNRSRQHIFNLAGMSFFKSWNLEKTGQTSNKEDFLT